MSSSRDFSKNDIFFNEYNLGSKPRKPPIYKEYNRKLEELRDVSNLLHGNKNCKSLGIADLSTEFDYQGIYSFSRIKECCMESCCFQFFKKFFLNS